MSQESWDASEYQDEYDICPFCSDDIVTTEKLLDFAIEKLGTTLEKLTEEYENGV
jgi:wobble nucleotide-excising tRNase